MFVCYLNIFERSFEIYTIHPKRKPTNALINDELMICKTVMVEHTPIVWKKLHSSRTVVDNGFKEERNAGFDIHVKTNK